MKKITLFTFSVKSFSSVFRKPYSLNSAPLAFSQGTYFPCASLFGILRLTRKSSRRSRFFANLSHFMLKILSAPKISFSTRAQKNKPLQEVYLLYHNAEAIVKYFFKISLKNYFIELTLILLRARISLSSARSSSCLSCFS